MSHWDLGSSTGCLWEHVSLLHHSVCSPEHTGTQTEWLPGSCGSSFSECCTTASIFCCWHHSSVALWEPRAMLPSPQCQDQGNTALLTLPSDPSHISSFAGNVGACCLQHVGLVWSGKMSPQPVPGLQGTMFMYKWGKICKRREHQDDYQQSIAGLLWFLTMCKGELPKSGK